MDATILIIDDNEELCRIMQMNLESKGFGVHYALDGTAGLRRFNELQPDLIILDVALPGSMDGLAICKRLRDLTLTTPILMMTAHAISEESIAEGLNTGADEYMIKPLGNIELHARINALLRRVRLINPGSTAVTVYNDGFLHVDLAIRRVVVDGREIRLTPTEFNLLAIFIQHAGEVLSFQQILERVWGKEYVSEHHYPRIYVSHLRRKIEPDFKNPTYIHNEYGIGYRFVSHV